MLLAISAGWLLLVVSGACDALRMINLDAPQWAIQGDTIALSCSFALEQQKQPAWPADDDEKELLQGRTNSEQTLATPKEQRFNLSRKSVSKAGAEATKGGDKQFEGAQDWLVNEQLYAIKWFKDGREFFRYLSREWPKKQPLPVDGVTLDEDKSDNHTVILKSVELKTSGLYRCEVSTDAPYFVTNSLENRLRIYTLPNGGPKVALQSLAGSKVSSTSTGQLNTGSEQLKMALHPLGSQLEFTCTAPYSKPAASLDWILNDSLNLSSALFSESLHNQFPALAPSHMAQFSLLNKRLLRFPISTTWDVSASSSPQPAAADSIIKTATLLGPRQAQFQEPIKGTAHPHLKQPLAYELLNDTFALPLSHSHLLGPPINLVSSHGNLLDQLTESSVSRLNLTVDSNLYQLLQQATSYSSRIQKSTNSLSPVPAAAVNHQKLPFHETTAKSISSRSSETNNSAFLSYLRPNQHLPPTAHKHRRLPNYSQTHSNSLTSDDILTGAQTKTWTVRVKCVARVLHLIMSDEIRLRFIINKKVQATEHHEENYYALSDAQKSHSERAKNSAVNSFQILYWMMFCLILSVFTFTLTSIDID